MPRPLRIEYPGAIYHVMSRGNRGEPIFLNDVDRHEGHHINSVVQTLRNVVIEITLSL